MRKIILLLLISLIIIISFFIYKKSTENYEPIKGMGCSLLQGTNEAHCNTWLDNYRNKKDCFLITNDPTSPFNGKKIDCGEALNCCNVMCKCNGDFCTGSNDPIKNKDIKYDSEICKDKWVCSFDNPNEFLGYKYPSKLDQSPIAQLVRSVLKDFVRDKINELSKTKINILGCDTTLDKISTCNKFDFDGGNAFSFKFNSIDGLLTNLRVYPPLQLQLWPWNPTYDYTSIPQTLKFIMPLKTSFTIDAAIKILKTDFFSKTNILEIGPICLMIHGTLKFMKNKLLSLDIDELTLLNWDVHVNDSGLKVVLDTVGINIHDKLNDFVYSYVNIFKDKLNSFISGFLGNDGFTLPLSLPPLSGGDYTPINFSEENPSSYVSLAGYFQNHSCDTSNPVIANCIGSCAVNIKSPACASKCCDAYNFCDKNIGCGDVTYDQCLEKAQKDSNKQFSTVDRDIHKMDIENKNVCMIKNVGNELRADPEWRYRYTYNKPWLESIPKLLDDYPNMFTIYDSKSNLFGKGDKISTDTSVFGPIVTCSMEFVNQNKKGKNYKSFDVALENSDNAKKGDCFFYTRDEGNVIGNLETKLTLPDKSFQHVFVLPQN